MTEILSIDLIDAISPKDSERTHTHREITNATVQTHNQTVDLEGKWRPMHCEPQQCFVDSSWLHEIVCVGFSWFCSVLVWFWFSFGWPLCRSVRGLLQPQPLLPGGVAAGGTTGSTEGAAGDWEEAAGPSVPRLDPLKLESSLWSLWTWNTDLLQVESTCVRCCQHKLLNVLFFFPFFSRSDARRLQIDIVGDERRAHQHG